MHLDYNEILHLLSLNTWSYLMLMQDLGVNDWLVAIGKPIIFFLSILSILDECQARIDVDAGFHDLWSRFRFLS